MWFAYSELLNSKLNCCLLIIIRTKHSHQLFWQLICHNDCWSATIQWAQLSLGSTHGTRLYNFIQELDVCRWQRAKCRQIQIPGQIYNRKYWNSNGIKERAKRLWITYIATKQVQEHSNGCEDQTLYDNGEEYSSVCGTRIVLSVRHITRSTRDRTEERGEKSPEEDVRTKWRRWKWERRSKDDFGIGT